MDDKAKLAHEALQRGDIDGDTHNRRIGEICAEHAKQQVMFLGHCDSCDCRTFNDAGEIGDLAERLAKVEARLAALDGKPTR